MDLVEFSDNRPVLDMLLSRPLGLLALLDEESRFPKSSDRTLTGLKRFKINLKAKLIICVVQINFMGTSNLSSIKGQNLMQCASQFIILVSSHKTSFKRFYKQFFSFQPGVSSIKPTVS